MPRDIELTQEKRRAIMEVFNRNMKRFGRAYRINQIYQMTANSPAPSFFITYIEGRRIIYASEIDRPYGRARELCSQRDKDFIEAYKKFMVQHRGCSKRWAVNEVINSPAPSFYVEGDMVATIVSGRENKNPCHANN